MPVVVQVGQDEHPRLPAGTAGLVTAKLDVPGGVLRSRSVRAWNLRLGDSEVTDAFLAPASGCIPRRLQDELPNAHYAVRDRVFVHACSDGLMLWTRPPGSGARAALLEGQYPDVLVLRVASHAEGSRVVARWRAHPLAKAARRRTFGHFVGLAAVGLALGLPLWVMLLVLPLVLVGVFGPRLNGSSRGRLLALAYAVLAPHERGQLRDERSGYRSDRFAVSKHVGKGR